MKRLIMAALLVIGISAFAQDKKEMEKRPHRTEMGKLTPEQRNQLKLKKMTLELDLDANQQEQVKQLIAEQSSKREARRAEQKARKEAAQKRADSQHFAMKNSMLDEQIAMKDKMKKILSPEQFEKWNSLREKREESGVSILYNFFYFNTVGSFTRIILNSQFVVPIKFKVINHIRYWNWFMMVLLM